MQPGREITEVGRLVEAIFNCRVVAAGIEMRLCRCPPDNAEQLARVRRKMLEVADKLEGR
ncbi:hypothetical protein [Bradyrhizobium sp. BR 10261]|uniref:hypothetical protein n=1 Tax=Bradyrhizobium sp. BR 10261 TaxID=2749992 RepID=UPI001C646233|nr:hypothetical protein [Bradyrhizobium sp. BR 10261]MBW7965285.1 hypothetical protein [Bradyrhizobium sp. BR 10261]